MDVLVETEAVEEVVSTEDIEVYQRSMSPTLLDISALLPEEREIDIITEEEDRRSLVRFMSYVFCMFELIFSSSNNVALSPHRASSRRLLNQLSLKFQVRKPQVAPILLRKRFTEQRQRKTWMKRRNCSILKKTLPILPVTTGKINTDLVNQDTSTESILVMSGINITRHIMSEFVDFDYQHSLTVS